jgi:hypothetical protein
VLALTPQHDQAYADRWVEVASQSERLLDAQQLEQFYQEHHHRC